MQKTTPDKQINGGFVLINNKFIFLQTFFTGNELVFEEDINLKSTNHLTVFLRGTPGASISVKVSEKSLQPSSPKILFFTADPPSIKTGGFSTLTWQTENAELCVIDPDVGEVDSSGALSVSPTTATTYILTASGGGDTVTSEVAVAIDNTAPVAESQVLITDEDEPVVVLLSGSDADGDSLSYEVLSEPQHGTLQGTPPNLTYTPVVDFNGEDEFTFSLNDGRVSSEPATVLIAVTAVNDAPIASDENLTTNEDTILTIDNVLANDSDIDGDDLIVSSYVQPANGQVTQVNNGHFTYSPNQNFFGNDSYSYTVSDGNGGSDDATVNIFVSSVNDRPISLAGVEQEVFVGENVQLDGRGSEDADGDPLTYRWIFLTVPQGSNATLSDDSSAEPVFVPDVSGAYEVQLIVNDGTVDSYPNVTTITVNPRMVQIPDVVGLSQTNAEASITGANLVVGSISTAHSSAIAVDHVISQNPGAGTLVAEGSTVDFVLSLGPIMATVPSVIGQSQVDAAAAITGANLAVGTISTAINNTVPVDQVISQDPAGGASVPEGSAVDLVISLGPAQPPTVSISVTPTTIAQGESATLSWTSSDAQSAHIDSGIGLVNPDGLISVAPEHTTTYTIAVIGETGSSSARITVKVTGNPLPQPEGSFGEKYEDLVPLDATVDQYDSKRFALITGKVQNAAGTAISDVSITILSHPEYGTVTTDTQGEFSIPVEGGGTLTVVCRKDGLISAQRRAVVPWNDTVRVETMVLIAEDSASTTMTFDGNADTVMTHTSTQVEDEYGIRSTTIVVNGDNRAYLTDENGNQVEELKTVNVRATEFTTRESMPAVLPSTSAVTYFVNLSVDGAERVSFNKPVAIWTDNFLGFPVGQIVPVGYYNPDKGIWVPQPNGVVVELLDTDGDSVADALDSDGDGEPNDLNNNDSFSDEVEGLHQAQLADVGDTYWRCEITHFSWVDKNWPFAYPTGSIDPNPPGYATVDQKAKEDDNACIASYVEQKGRILHEDIPIPGTDFNLHYDSSRVAGYLPGVFTIPASGDTVPDTVMWIEVQLRIAGKLYSVKLDPLPNQTAKIEWDGLDHLGRAVTGSIMADVKIDFVYSATYALPSNRGRAFGQPGTEVMDIDTRIPYPKSLRYSLPVLRGKGSLAEGWTISPHHWVSPVNTSSIFKGDGTINRNNATIIETFAGNGTGGYGGDGAAATESQINNPYGIRVDSSGEVYFADFDNGVVRVVNKDGIITTVPNIGYTTRFAIAPNGNIYYINGYNLWVRYPNGNTERIAGDYHGGYNGEGMLAKNARLWPSYVYVDTESNIYLAEANNHRVRKIDTAGIITTVAGNGAIGHGGDGGRATQAQLYYPDSVVVDNSGNIIITENDRVRKVDPTGIITTFAGPGSYDNLGDGGPAVDAYVRDPGDLATDVSGNVYILEGSGNRVRRVDTTGVITTVAGTGGENGYGGDNGPATGAQLWSPKGLALDADGNIYISDNGNDRIRVVSPPGVRLAGIMDVSDYAFTEESGVGYIMSPAGYHKTTIDLATGITLYEFGYDDNDNLVSVTDVFGNTTTIEYIGELATAIISQDGIRTDLSVDDSNHLTRITYPGSNFYDFEYSLTGLLTVKTEPEGNRFYHAYDADGRLIESSDEHGGFWTFTREVLDTGEVLHQVVTGEGNVTTYLDSTASTGEFTSSVTDPSGAESNITHLADEWTVNQSLSCGMEQTEIYDIDPEYKFRFVKKLTQSTPSGLDRVLRKEMTYQDTNSDDVPDTITEFVSLNNKETRIANNVLQSQNVITSPEGRTITSQYDPATLRVENVSIPGLFDTSYGYDARGRLTSIGTNTRQTSFVYDVQGFLESVTDSENHSTTFSYDPVGRITGISRPDGG
ncbi:MAG: tandem-95 repeat protein, partial [Desulfobacterales bacterium]